MKYVYTIIFLLIAVSVSAREYNVLAPKDSDAEFYGPVHVVTCTDGDTVTTDCGNEYSMYGSIIQIVSGTVTLPEATTGLWSCVKSTSAAVIYIDIDDNDRWVLDGVDLAAGDKLESPGNDDDTVCFYADSASGWTTVHNPDGFIDGN